MRWVTSSTATSWHTRPAPTSAAASAATPMRARPTHAPSSSPRRARHAAFWKSGWQDCQPDQQDQALRPTERLAAEVSNGGATVRLFFSHFNGKEPAVKYLCLVYLSAEKWSACSDSACAAYAGQLKD